jgi:hypothetical protein
MGGIWALDEDVQERPAMGGVMMMMEESELSCALGNG